MTHTLPPHVEWARPRACDGKIRYTNWFQAMRAAVRSAYTLGEPVSTWDYFKCRVCRFWHAGHKPGVRRG